MEVILTNGVPQCPSCNKLTRRKEGISMVTALYYPPIYDENGNNTNPDRNNSTTNYKCLECKQDYCISGNFVDGYKYL